MFWNTLHVIRNLDALVLKIIVLIPLWNIAFLGGVILANFLKLYHSNRRKKKNNLWFRNSNLKKIMNQINNKKKTPKMDCSVSYIKKIIVLLSVPKNAKCAKKIPKSVSNVNKNMKWMNKGNALCQSKAKWSWVSHQR